MNDLQLNLLARGGLFAAVVGAAVVFGNPDPEPVRWVPVIETNSGYTHQLHRDPSSLVECMAYLTEYGEPEGLAASWCEKAK